MRRRDTISGIAALSLLGACRDASGAAPIALSPLKQTLPFPIGTCGMIGHLKNPDWIATTKTHFSRLSAEWEMKMEYMAEGGKAVNFDRPDAFVNFAQSHGLLMHGHTLIWYAQDGGFEDAYRNRSDADFINGYVDYIATVMGRYRGRVASWDVVNEPITDDGQSVRDCIWKRRMGEDYMGIAFEAAHEADPKAIRVLNEYHLELKPQKRKTFLQLVDRLLHNGAKIDALGCQTHIDAALPKGAISAALKDLSATGLKVFMSEIDISTKPDFRLGLDPVTRQAEILDELLNAYDQIPKAQQMGLTFWGVRDEDSWLNRDNLNAKDDQPLLFRGAFAPKPLAAQLSSHYSVK